MITLLYSRVHPTSCSTKRNVLVSNAGGGDKNFSQEGRKKKFAFFFHRQEGGTRISPRKDVFDWLTKSVGEKKPMIGRTRRKTKENFPGKACRSEKSSLNFSNTSFISYRIFYVSQEDNVLRTDISKNTCQWLFSTCIESHALSLGGKCKCDRASPTRSLQQFWKFVIVKGRAGGQFTLSIHCRW